LGLTACALAPNLLLAVLDEIQEKLVNAGVIRKFGMECRGQGASLPHCNGVIAFGCQYFNPCAQMRNLWGSDENHLQRRRIEVAIQITHQLAFPDRTVDLSRVCITADPDVERAQTGLRRILDLTGQQDCARAGAESRFQANELLKLLKTSRAKELDKGARLASGHH
jgi:hypothetical protein